MKMHLTALASSLVSFVWPLQYERIKAAQCVSVQSTFVRVTNILDLLMSEETSLHDTHRDVLFTQPPATATKLLVPTPQVCRTDAEN